MKRLFSMLLVLAMVLGLFPNAAWAAAKSDTITVYVTVSDKGKLSADKNGEPMGYRAVTVPDVDGNGTYSIFDAYFAAHEQFCTDEFLLSGGGMVGQLWGDRSGNFLTFVNNVGIDGTPLKNQPIADGDHLVGAILSDSTAWSDCNSFFDAPAKEVTKGAALVLALSGSKGMSDDAPAPLSGLSVGIWEDGDFTPFDGKITDKSGCVSLVFDTVGTYCVTADGSVSSTSSLTGWARIIAPVCMVTVTEEKTDAEYVASDKDALTLTYLHGQDLTLPQKGQSGRTDITWVSDKTNVISHKGEVTKPINDTTVTLTATITCGKEHDIKELTVNVPGRLSAAAAALLAEPLRPVEFTGATDAGYSASSKVNHTNILTVAEEVVCDEDISVSFAESFAASDVIGEDGTITYPKDAAELTLPLKLTFDGQSTEVTATALIPKHAQTKAEVIAEMKAALAEYLNSPSVLNGNASLDEIKTELYLPGGKSSGIYIKWTSKNTNLIASRTDPKNIRSNSEFPTGGYYTVPVTRPGDADTTVKLEAQFDYSSSSVDLPAGPKPSSADRKITFEVTVLALNDTERDALLNGADGDIRLFDKNGEVADLLNIKTDLYFPTYPGITTTWSTDIESIEIPEKGAGTAYVTRPETGSDDEIGHITLTFTVGGVSTSKSFAAIVPAWTQEEVTEKQDQLNRVAEALTFDVIKGSNVSADAVSEKLALKLAAGFADETVNFDTYTKNRSNWNKWPVSITWSINPADGPITFNPSKPNLGAPVTRPAQDTRVELTATIDFWPDIRVPGVDAATKTVTVTVPTATSLDVLKLLENIAAGYTESSGYWEVTDLGAYAKLFPSASVKTSDSARQTLINNAVRMLTTGKNEYGSDAGAGDWAKCILALTAAGIDPGQLYAVNSNTTLSAIDKLDAVATASASAWVAPYVLQAYHQGSYDRAAFETTLVDALLDSQQENGSWEEFGTVDTTANVITALALYKGRPEVQTAIDNAVTFLSEAQLEDGTFDDGQTGGWAAGSNANSTAMVIIALAANGINPNTDSRFMKSGKSLLFHFTDAFALLDSSGFGYKDHTEYNAASTEQCFRALISAYGVMSTGEAYRVYDVCGGTLVPGRATGSGSVATPSVPSGNNITVTVTVKSDTDYWMNGKTVTIPGTDATVYHALIAALGGSGITQVGAASGYVTSMTKDGKTLAEFSSGENSGWMYKVNGESPGVGLTDCPIRDGDRIVWFYTDDWTEFSGGMGASSIPDEEDTEEFPFRDVSESDDCYDAVKWAVEHGITTGTDENTFSPDAVCARGQIITFLWRANDNPEPASLANPFADVSSDAYFRKSVLWAVEHGITSGTSASAFSPDAVCTRAQIVTFLWRAAGKPQANGTNPFADVSSDAYYYDAVLWAVEQGITDGTSATTFSPDAACTRGQAVTLLYRFYHR